MKVDILGHEPVLLKETVELLNIKPGGKYIDATLGAGGHGIEIVRRGGELLGLDQDKEALRVAESKFKIENLKLKIGENPILVHGNFKNIKQIAQEHGFFSCDGILFDLGVSSMQLDTPGRGFSFREDAPLDMRMDPENQGVTAADLINSLPHAKLYELFNSVTANYLARRFASAIISARPISRTAELADLANRVMPKTGKTSPATTIFMALRMAVNSEIENLEAGLAGALDTLANGGRLVVISFHSGEDRIVKEYFMQNQKIGTLKVLTQGIVRPTSEEIYYNSRSRSAKLRVAQKS